MNRWARTGGGFDEKEMKYDFFSAFCTVSVRFRACRKRPGSGEKTAGKFTNSNFLALPLETENTGITLLFREKPNEKKKISGNGEKVSEGY